MKIGVVVLCLLISACATRHMPDTASWHVDCYNKKQQEAMLARTESRLSADDTAARRRVRQMFWDLQKECQ